MPLKNKEGMLVQGEERELFGEILMTVIKVIIPYLCLFIEAYMLTEFIKITSVFNVGISFTIKPRLYIDPF